jgi:hypothetical protein
MVVATKPSNGIRHNTNDDRSDQRHQTANNPNRGVRTTDSSPPVIASLSATWTPPMTLVLRANVSKGGAVRFLARREGQPPPASAQELLSAVAANNLAAANFTGSVPVPTAGAVTTAQLCVADGDVMVLYAVAQDREGETPGRWPNNSTLSR